MGVYTNNINNLSGLGSPPPDIYHQAVGSTMLSLLYKIAYDNNYLLLMEQGSERDKKALRYDLLLTKISQPAPGKYGDNILIIEICHDGTQDDAKERIIKSFKKYKTLKEGFIYNYSSGKILSFINNDFINNSFCNTLNIDLKNVINEINRLFKNLK